MTLDQNCGSTNPPPPYPSGCEVLAECSGRDPKACSSSTFEQISRSFDHASRYFSISFLDGRLGYGAFAKCDIPKHTLILEEPPLLPCDFLQQVLEKHEQGELKCHVDDDQFLKGYFSARHSDDDVRRLTTMVWSMHDQYADDNFDVGNNQSFGTDTAISNNATSKKRLWGIIYSNAFYNAESTTKNASANATNAKVFRPTLHFLAAKLNHSCAPNVGYDFSSDSQRMFTTRDVKKGEELFDCYSDVVYHEPAWVRRAFLKEKYNFDCQCSACFPSCKTNHNTDHDNEHDECSNESDDRRRRLKDIAISLSNRVGAAFLYNEKFDNEVQQIVSKMGFGDDDTDPDDEDSWNEDINGVSVHSSTNNDRCRPTSGDLYDLLDYLHLLRLEGIDHDAIECMELAFDLATFLYDKNVLKEYDLGQKCLAVYEIAKGEKHKATKAFRKKLQKHELALEFKR